MTLHLPKMQIKADALEMLVHKTAMGPGISQIYREQDGEEALWGRHTSQRSGATELVSRALSFAGTDRLQTPRCVLCAPPVGHGGYVSLSLPGSTGTPSDAGTQGSRSRRGQGPDTGMTQLATCRPGPLPRALSPALLHLPEPVLAGSEGKGRKAASQVPCLSPAARGPGTWCATQPTGQ